MGMLLDELRNAIPSGITAGEPKKPTSGESNDSSYLIRNGIHERQGYPKYKLF